MKVRLAYTTELESVPGQVAGLVQSATESLDEIINLLSSSAILLKNDPHSPEYVVKLLDNVRRKMTSVDEGLNDSHALLQGYVKTVSPTTEDPIPFESEEE